MILIRSKEQYQNCSCQQQPKDEAFTVERLSNLAGAETTLLESSSEFVGNSAGVGSDEIARANSARNITRLGQVASIISGSSEAGMSTGRNRGEGNISALLGIDFERPLSIDSLNVAQRNLNAVQQVVQHNAAISDFNTGSPQQQVAAKPQPAGQDGAFQQTIGSEFDEAERERQQQNRAKAEGQIFAEAGSKSHTAMTLGGK